MIKAIFHIDTVAPESVAQLSELGITSLFTAPGNLDDAIVFAWEPLKEQEGKVPILKQLYSG